MDSLKIGCYRKQFVFQGCQTHEDTFQSEFSRSEKESVSTNARPAGDSCWSIRIQTLKCWPLLWESGGLPKASAPCAIHPSWRQSLSQVCMRSFPPRLPPAPSPRQEERQYSGSGPFDVLIFIHCHASISGPQALQKQFQSCKNDSNLMEILVLIQVWWTLLICVIMSFSKTELKRCLHLTISGSSGWTCGITGDRRKSSPLPLPLPAPFSLPFCNEYALVF